MKSEHDYLSEALAPRDENGHQVPIVFPGGTGPDGKPLYFPYLPPSKGEGDVPILFNEDFAPGGQFYGLTYQSGFYASPLGLMDSGIEAPLFPGDVVFTDPRLNMPQLTSTVMQQGLPPEMIPTANHVMAALGYFGAKYEPTDDLLNQGEAKYTLFLKNRKGQTVPICNTGLEVTTLRRIVDDEKTTFEVCLRLLRKGVEIAVPEASLDNLDSFIGSKFPWFHLATDTPNAAALLTEHIRDELDQVPEITVVKHPGWFVHQGKHIYAHDGLGTMRNLSCETGHTIPFDLTMSPADAYTSALGLLDIGSHAVTVPLLLTSIAGTLAALFQEAGYPPRFCTFLYGLSGSLKTAAAEVFTGFYGRRDHSTFRDSKASVDVNIAMHRDRVLLIDDFQPPLVSADGKAMRQVLEHVIRLFGDDVAKQRSNSTATATHGKRPRGTCIITGESISGSYSSLLRCLLVPVTRGDIDGTMLSHFQEAPERWCSNYVHFLHWVGENWDNLVNKVRARFTMLRTSFSQLTAEPRLVDSGVLLRLTGEILLDYGMACGAIECAGREEYLCEWRSILCDTLTFSTNLANEVDLVSLCREALNTAQEVGTLRVAATVDDFQPGMDGFLSADRLWLRSEALLREMRKKSAEMSAACTLSAKEILPELYSKGLILRDEEEGKHSYLKKTPTIPALGKRIRMVCFDRNELNTQS